MTEKRCPQQLTWADFPVRKEVDGWHCRRCQVLLTGRRTSWCSRECEKAVLLLVHWRYIRACILRRDKWRCQMLLEDGSVCGRHAHEVDHIVELADGGSFHEWSNLRSTCDICHKKKTAAMRTARAAAKKAQTKPIITEEESITTTRCTMATETVNFTSLKNGALFTIAGERFKKASDLTYTSLDNPILGETYSTPGLKVVVEAVAKPAAKTVAKKKTKR